jgi:hypothetical protein
MRVCVQFHDFIPGHYRVYQQALETILEGGELLNETRIILFLVLDNTRLFFTPPDYPPYTPKKPNPEPEPVTTRTT